MENSSWQFSDVVFHKAIRAAVKEHGQVMKKFFKPDILYLQV